MLSDEIGAIVPPLREQTHVPRLDASQPQLILLAAGRGSRFGDSPKCVHPVLGNPLARYTIGSFACVSTNPAICVVGYRSPEVMEALGSGNRYVESANPTGGTGWAALEAVAHRELLEADPLLCIAMGDRVVPPEVFRRVLDRHRRERPDLTLLSLRQPLEARQGKGRVVLDSRGGVAGIREQRDIDGTSDSVERTRLLAIDIVNASLYVVRARALHDLLRRLTRVNAQGQYYLTDIVALIAKGRGRVVTETIGADEPAHRLLSCDLTRLEDLPGIEDAMRTSGLAEAAEGAAIIRLERPDGQLAAIARQMHDLAGRNDLDPGREIGIGITGGRLRIAFMHPDMVRFYGPAWQIPIGSHNALARHQIVTLVQPREDGKVRLAALNPFYRDDSAEIPADAPWSYPGPEVSDWYAYEAFGTGMTREILLLLGFTDEALGSDPGKVPASTRPARLVSANMRRPFPLVMNALGSLRTRASRDPAVRRELLPPGFHGMDVVLDGDIPRGGFSSSSAVTVAVLNALNALHRLGLVDEQVVSLACQAEFGTGVRAGSLDQATEQMGSATHGAVVSSNPRDGFRVLGRFAVPVDRIRILFPYSVDRDREAWRWSAGTYGADAASETLTTGEVRKLTGKSAEMAAIMLGVSLEHDLFGLVEGDLLSRGSLSTEADTNVRNLLGSLPRLIGKSDLAGKLADREGWLTRELSHAGASAADAEVQARRQISTLLDGWREPRFGGRSGAPLRAMVAYLFAEVAKCFHLAHHPEDWIGAVTRSQAGDRWFTIDPEGLPPAESMTRALSWERGLEGPRLMEEWLVRCGAAPHDLDLDIDDASLATTEAAPPRLWRGPSFFRGLALFDLVEAMLKRAFGSESIALRVNAAGQGDFFQVHVDTRLADTEEVKSFIRAAVYRRFAIQPDQDFVEVHPGGRAVGVRLGAFGDLPILASLLQP